MNENLSIYLQDDYEISYTLSFKSQDACLFLIM